MANLATASAAYESVDLHSQIEGASSHELVNLLFKGALERLARAKGCMQTNNVSGKGESIGGAIAIIVELQSCLVSQEDSEISDNLNQLYTYLITTISNANVNNDRQSLDEACELLTHLKDSWNMIPEENR